MGELDRLRWRCRRGLLELDLILKDFVEAELYRLDVGQREILGELLDRPDTELLDWALGRTDPPDARFGELVKLLRAAQPSRVNFKTHS